MSDDLQDITTSLNEFHTSINIFKSQLNEPQEQIRRDGSTVNMYKDKCNKLSQDITKKFKSGKFSNRTAKQKLEKDFNKLLDMYKGLCEQYKNIKQEEIEELRNTYRDSRQMSIKHQTESGEMELSQKGDQNMQEEIQIHPELQIMEQIMEERNKELQELQKDVTVVHQMMVDMAKMVSEQGQVLDVIQDNIDNSNQQVKQANVNLNQAQDLQQAHRKKMCCIMILLLVVALIIVLPIVLTKD